MITVKQAIEHLQQLPQDAILVSQKDSEGNGYSPVHGLDGNCVYVPKNSYSGEVYSKNVDWHEHYEMDQEDCEEILHNGLECVVVFPIN